MSRGLLGSLFRGWAKQVGSEVRDIKYSYFTLTYLFVFTAMFSALAYYFYFLQKDTNTEIWEIIILAILYFLFGIFFGYMVYRRGKNCVEEGSVEAEELLRKRETRRLKLKIFYVTQKQRRILYIFEFMLYLVVLSYIVGAILILTLL